MLVITAVFTALMNLPFSNSVYSIYEQLSVMFHESIHILKIPFSPRMLLLVICFAIFLFWFTKAPAEVKF